MIYNCALTGCTTTVQLEAALQCTITDCTTTVHLQAALQLCTYRLHYWTCTGCTTAHLQAAPLHNWRPLATLLHTYRLLTAAAEAAWALSKAFVLLMGWTEGGDFPASVTATAGSVESEGSGSVNTRALIFSLISSMLSPAKPWALFRCLVTPQN